MNMTSKIFKYPLDVTDKQTLVIPVGSRLLDAQFQDGRLYAWLLIGPDQKNTFDLTFRIVGTGNPVEENPGDYLTTVQQFGGKLIWHIFFSVSGA